MLGLDFREQNIPDPLVPHIAGGLLLEEAADLLDLCLARRRIEEQVAQLGGVGLDVNSTFRSPGIALEHKDLVLGPAFLLEGLHRSAVVE